MKKISKSFRKWINLFKKDQYLQKNSWKSVFLISFIVICIYQILEWVFLATKPSFFGSDSILIQFKTILFSISLFTIILSIFMVILYLVSILFKKRGQRILIGISLFLPSLVLSSLILLIIDNFTYTVFNFGIATTNQLRFIYLILFLIILVSSYSLLTHQFGLTAKSISLHNKAQKYLVPVIYAIELIIFATTIRFSTNQMDASFKNIQPTKTPNIYIFTADGINASHTSVYGYQRDTTPYIKELAKNSLVAENAFSNAGNTAGSLISIYTGKYPIETRVLYSPDILKNNDSYEHLPGILKLYGYTSIQLSYPYYADAYDLNLRSGFDMANGRAINESGILTKFYGLLDSDESYYLYLITNRIIDRILHITYIKNMDNLSLLAKGSAQVFDFKDKFDLALDLTKNNQNPVFVHIHYMRSHGPQFMPDSRVYSAGKTNSDGDLDFYDDTILDFDKAVGSFIERLKSIGEYDNSIIIIGSDHAINFQTDIKIPMIIHFPKDEYAGNIISDVQNLDIAPTILKYMDITQPKWMMGQPLQSIDLHPVPIISVGIKRYHMEGEKVVSSNNVAPFYQFGYINIINCNQKFNLDLNTQLWKSGIVEDYIGNCPKNELITEQQAYTIMINLMRQNGFNINSLHETSILSEK